MRFLVPLALALYCAVAAAQLYSWKDADGKVHYSDEPPADTTHARKLAPPAAGAAADPAARRSLAAKEMESRRKQKEAQEAASKAEKDKADAEERRVECARAQGNLKALESGQTRFTIDANGERVGLDGELRDAELAKARKAADSWCN
ncbi:MAG: DUF4124 domain-containing protein [Rhodocyclaceae bacterium]|nr:DUF4124 domain-containing protein [Rhodocyclaceae bacterium]